MKKLDPSIRKRIEGWLGGAYDEETRREIQQMLDTERFEELTDAFYKDLDFGTGGLRGIMGVGTNRMNRYTVAKATQGLANYLKKIHKGESVRVVIARDNRNNAEAFAQVVADVFSANGIRVFVFEDLRPTPELSFAIRHLDCHSGVMLTASHNPKEYSGYKAYWRDGGQVVPPHDKKIIEEVNRIDSVEQVRFNPDPSLISVIGEEIDRAYIDRLLSLRVHPESIRKEHDLRIVYSPIHGTGVRLIPETLGRAGFTEVHPVEEQCSTDGDFSTVVYPNPEEEEALSLALEKARELDAELVMATDPDADRVGIVVRNREGELELLNGNQAAALLFHYVLGGLEEKKELKKGDYVVKTIVTSYLLDEIAAAKGVECYNVLTGFKYIGELMTKLEGEKRFVVGGEESYGYLVGDHVRDKDAVVSCLMFAEMAAHYKSLGKSLFDVLLEIYRTYGLYRERLISIKRDGKAGEEEIRKMMEGFRQETPDSLAGRSVAAVRDYQSGMERLLASGQERPIDLPRSNVLQFVTDHEDVISIRPSGTEPKIKFYVSVRGTLPDPTEYRTRVKELETVIDRIVEDLKL